MATRSPAAAAVAVLAATALAACGPADDPGADASATETASASETGPSPTGSAAGTDPPGTASPTETDRETGVTPGEPLTLQVGWAEFVDGVRIVLLSASGPDGECDDCPAEATVELDDGSAREALDLRVPAGATADEAEEARTGTAFGWTVRLEGVVDGEAELLVTPADTSTEPDATLDPSARPTTRGEPTIDRTAEPGA